MEHYFLIMCSLLEGQIFPVSKTLAVCSKTK